MPGSAQILARTAVEVPHGLVQHFAEGHDVKCAEGGGLGNTAAAVVQAITAAVEAKCWGAKATQRVGADAAFGIAKENRAGRDRANDQQSNERHQ